jgi:hypothetical protein
MLEQMLSHAESLVDRGAEWLRAQEGRVAALENKGLPAGNSSKLLKTMKQTQKLQVEYVELLKQELAVA